MGKLTALQVQRFTKPGFYSDGGCLYLQVKGDGVKRLSRSWIYRFSVDGRRRDMGLGSLTVVSLLEARKKVLDVRKQYVDGIDPIEVRKAKREQDRLERAKEMTFKVCAEKYIAVQKAGWKNEKHAAQWPSTLETYAYPLLGKLAVQNIDTGLVMKVLEPIWATKSETASRLRGRIEVILDWAKVHSYRKGDNPACWRGHLDKLLPRRSKVKKVKHHAALPYSELPDLMTKLRRENSVAALSKKTIFDLSCMQPRHRGMGRCRLSWARALATDAPFMVISSCWRQTRSLAIAATCFGKGTCSGR